MRPNRPARRALRAAALTAAAGLAASATALAWADEPEAEQDSTLTVATDGDDANPGTVEEPLQTLQAAVDLAEPGTVIQIREGTYAPDTNVQILADGTTDAPITMRPYESEQVVIDGENMPHTPAPVDGSIPREERGALHIEGDFWHFENLEIINGPYAIFALDSNDNVYDGLTTRDNYESGLHIQGASSNNLVRNLDAYGNRDPRNSGESADGLAIKEGEGEGNRVVGARLWNNSDDGFDAWEFLSPVTVEDSVAWGNGYDRWDIPGYAGDGNGFKMGGGDPDPAADHVVTGSIAFENSQHGFTDNGNPGSLTIERSTAWANEETGFDFDASTSALAGDLAVGNATPAALGSSASTDCSWDLADDWSDADLASTDPAAITGDRTEDGSIPSTDFLRPNDYADLGADFS